MIDRIRFAARAGLWHFFGSCLLAAVTAMLVFLIWYPSPYAQIAGGLTLFTLLVSVDVVLGPALTALVANPVKPRKELYRDIAMIVAVQLGALAYGVYVIAGARPVLLSFEVDRFRVVSAVDVDSAQLDQAPADLNKLSWTGPKVIAAVKSANKQDMLESVKSALAGFDISTKPSHWRDFVSQSDAAWRVARPVSVLLARYPQAGANIAAIAATAGLPVDQLRFLPVVSRHASWVALVAPPEARIAGFLPLEGFF